MKRCPQCGLENEEDAWLCNCGYEFGGPEDAAAQGEWPPPIPGKARKNRDGCIKSAVLAAAVAFALLIAYMITVFFAIRFFLPRMHH